MSNEDGSLWIVFNGEIFNYIELREELVTRGHHFKTGSDTEVILHLYEEKGAEALEALNGQFAFAIWDSKRKELFLARDRIGIRPLFFARDGRNLVFGSEIKAIFAHHAIPRELDLVALDDVLTFWFPVSQRTAFRGVRELPPGHFLRVRLGKEVLRRYWDLPAETDAPGLHDEKYYASKLRELMVDSVRLQLRADVPVGAFLSGGLDSSVITSLIRNYTKSPLCTFSVRFSDPEFDEGAKQKKMAEYLGTTHKEVFCGYSDIADTFSKVIWHAEVPLVRTAPVPIFLLSKLVRDSAYKVVLTGEGADEILAGYDLFKELKVRRFMESMPESSLRPLLLRRLYPYLKNSPTRSVAFARAFFGAAVEPFPPQFHAHAPRWNMTSMIKLFYSSELREAISEHGSVGRISEMLGDGAKWEKLDPMTWAQEVEMKTFLPGYLLSSQGDRMLMGNSVEGRFPFLDHRVVEFAMKIPPNIRMKGLTEKHILRKSMADLLPKSVKEMTKQPYRAPDAKSFLGASGSEVAEEMLSGNCISRKGYFDPKLTEGLVKKCRGNPSIGFKDNMAFIGILSTQLLDQLYLQDFDASGEISADRVRVMDPQNWSKKT
jgi:asparagine synthase (glutamine-hydrolysing)